ncbi:MAG: polysaccharide pyruvyl transferase family protein, partial [Verrucomicrobiia bacterium]
MDGHNNPDVLRKLCHNLSKVNERPRIVILNAYDSRNLGDQAIVLCQVAWARRKFPGIRVEVATNYCEAGSFAGLPTCENPLHCPAVGSRIRTLLRPIFDLVGWLLGFGPGGKKRMGYRSCQLAIVCGGGYLYSSTRPLLSRTMVLACLNAILLKREGIPVLMFPQSIGPLTKSLDRWMVRCFGRTLGRLVVRGDYSFACVNELDSERPVTVLPDVVLALPTLCPQLLPTARSADWAGVAPVNFGYASPEGSEAVNRYVNALADALERFHRACRVPLRLFTQVSVGSGDHDGTVVQELHARLKAREVAVEMEPATTD